MNSVIRLFSVVVICCLLSIVARGAATAVHSPRPGSRERAAIMDALRRPVVRVVKRRVIFKVNHLRVSQGWAFLEGSARNTDGSALGERYLWGELTALLRLQSGRKGSHWQVLYWGFATDTSVMESCKKKYPTAPRAIFP